MIPFTNIYNLAMMTITSYKIDNLKNKDYNSFCEYMRGLLTIGIPEFRSCFQKLDFHQEEMLNEDTGDITMGWFFDNNLSLDEQSILAKIVVLKWWTSLVQDIIAFQPKLTNREFKQIGNEQNLKQKSEYKDKLREEISQDITDYQLSNLQNIPFFGGN